jgi:G3E family GTPase
MDLKKIQPNDILSFPETGIQELLRIVLMRTNFVPGVRHVIGWRGLKDSSSSVAGWTARIKDFAGVFGIHFDRSETVGGWINGKFMVNYFPDPDEELVEFFSLQAGLHTQKDDYLLHVRNFLLYPELCELFNIGIIDLCVHQAEEALLLALESISRQRVIAKDGVYLAQNGHMVKVVEPGGYEQDFPSYNTSFAFYEVLAASITFNLKEAPVYLRYMTQNGTEITYDSSGNHWENPSDEAQKEYLYLGYGKADFENDIARMFKKSVSSITNIVWEKGDAILPDYKDELWWNAHKISDYKTLDKKILGIDDRAQFIVVTGFLGSGKTTFLQNFIEYHVQRNRFVAIIQNEIGEIGLDGKLLDHDYSVTEIDEGCVCCTLIGSLKNAIHQILSSFHPDYIVLETTGLANPYNLLDEISEVNELVRFDSITTLVDGLNVRETLQNYEVAKNQIKAADILLLNKKDLLDEIQLKEVHQKLKEINPGAPILSTTKGDINPSLIYGIDPQDTKEIIPTKDLQGKIDHPYYSHKDDGLSSYKISFSRPLDRERFLDAIRSLPRTIFRIKGVIDFVDSKMPLVFQYVGGRFEFSEFNNPNLSERFIILIGQDIQKKSIDSVLNNHNLMVS